MTQCMDACYNDKSGDTKLSKYSGRDEEYIYSISRELLTALLIDEAEALENVSFEFDQKCDAVDFENNIARFTHSKNGTPLNCKANRILEPMAPDQYQEKLLSKRKFLFNFSQNFLTHGYKELTIPATKEGGYKTEKMPCISGQEATI